jgi:hypothetical protein
MIPVHSILEVGDTYGSLGVSYLSYAFGDGKQPKRMTYLPIRDANGITVHTVFVPAEVL